MFIEESLSEILSGLRNTPSNGGCPFCSPDFKQHENDGFFLQDGKKPTCQGLQKHKRAMWNEMIQSFVLSREAHCSKSLNNRENGGCCVFSTQQSSKMAAPLNCQ